MDDTPAEEALAFGMLNNPPADRIQTTLSVHPTCVGRRVQDTNGYMPRTKGPNSLDNLRTVYAAMPIHLTPEYKEVELYIRLLVSRNCI